MRPSRRELILASGALLGGALGSSCKRSAANEVVIYTSVDQVFAEPVLRAIESSTGLTVRAVYDTEETKSTGVTNRLIAESSHPQADVFWSGDPVRPISLALRGVVEPYGSPAAGNVPPAFRAEDGSWTGVGARARVLLVNKLRLGSEAPPTSLQALVDPRFRGRCALANPLFGTTTMHVAALAVVWGDAELIKFLDAVKANGAKIAASNGDVKRMVVAGEIAFGLTDSDDANEALKDLAPVEAIFPDQDALGTLVIPTAVSLIRGRPHAEAGKKLLNALLGDETEARLVADGAHMPVRPATAVAARRKRANEIRALAVDFVKVSEAMGRLEPRLRQWVGL